MSKLDDISLTKNRKTLFFRVIIFEFSIAFDNDYALVLNNWRGAHFTELELFSIGFDSIEFYLFTTYFV